MPVCSWRLLNGDFSEYPDGETMQYFYVGKSGGKSWGLIGLFVLLLIPGGGCLADLPATIDRVKPSIVGVGTVQKTRRPPHRIVGTGFVVADGNYVITNAHVIPKKINTAKLEYLAIFAGKDKKMDIRQAVKVRVDEAHDLALLKFEGKPLPALTLGRSSRVREGEEYAFTGYPLGIIFGLYPVTHSGIISSIVPIAMQANSANQLDPAQIKRLRRPYTVFQLDATAYPGNSGSPLYQPDSGEVIGVINKVFVKEGRENVLAKPSGISYAIPIEYARELLKKAGLN
jgi:S1-C subfamily serine protease